MLLHEMFIRTARTHAARTAIVDRVTHRRLTYQRTLAATLVLARHMNSFEEGFVGIMLPNSAPSIIAILAVLVSGRVPVLINYSTGAAENVAFAQRTCGFRTVVTARSVIERLQCPVVPGMVFLEDIMKEVSFLDKVRGGFHAGRSEEHLFGQLGGGHEDDPACMLFTSGSESEPKAVPLSHRNIRTNLEGVASVWKYSPEDVLLANLPYFHIFGFTLNLWLPLMFGMTIVTAANPLDFKGTCESIREEGVVYVGGTPSFLSGYLGASAPGDFKTVRMILSGGDRCPDAVRDGYRQKHGIEVYEGYGTTETSPIISVNVPGSSRPGSAGRPLPNIDVRIEDYETGADCASGVTGKILVRGASVMAGYFDDLERTSLCLRHGWYDTGDMGFVDEDGFLWHVGRLKRFVKVHGEMISLVRVEDVLQRCLPPHVGGCVVELPDAVRGARIIAALSAPVDERDVLRRMSAEMANIAMPRAFVVLGELPRMGSGKIDVRAVTDLVRDRLQA